MSNLAENLDNAGDLYDRKQALETARSRDLSAKNDEQISSNEQSSKSEKRSGEKISLLKNAASLATPRGAASLLKCIHPLGDMPYVAAMMAALLKDGSDLVLIGSLPGVGTVLTACCSIFIGMMFFLAGINEKTAKKARRLAKSKTFQKTMIRLLAIFLGTTIEFVPGIDFFPVESAIVVIVYTWTLKDRKKAQEET